MNRRKFLRFCGMGVVLAPFVPNTVFGAVESVGKTTQATPALLEAIRGFRKTLEKADPEYRALVWWQDDSECRVGHWRMVPIEEWDKTLSDYRASVSYRRFEP